MEKFVANKNLLFQITAASPFTNILYTEVLYFYSLDTPILENNYFSLFVIIAFSL